MSVPVQVPVQKKRYATAEEFVSSWVKVSKSKGSLEDVCNDLNLLDIHPITVGSLREREHKLRKAGLNLPKLSSKGGKGVKRDLPKLQALLEQLTEI